jgi:hypothetical protein
MYIKQLKTIHIMKATKWLKEHFEHLKNDQEKMSWNQIIDITTLACDI